MLIKHGDPWTRVHSLEVIRCEYHAREEIKKAREAIRQGNPADAELYSMFAKVSCADAERARARLNAGRLKSGRRIELE